MINFAKRNLKLFFRDRSAVFFSLMAVFIIIGLYALFLGDVWVNNFSDIENARTIMNSWIMAGLLAVTSMTTTMGAFGVLVEDKTRKIYKDFYSAPVKRRSLAGGYVLGAFIIGVIMSIVTLVLAEIYLVVSGGELLSLTAFLKVFGLILLATMANTAIVFFIVSFFRSQNAFATASSIIGTLIGFLTGIYLPIGSLPEGVQLVIKIFPVSHAAVLFRQVMMEAPLSTSGIPQEYLTEFNEMMGVTFRFGDYTVTPLVSVLILLVTAALFFGLSVFNVSRKKGQL